MAACASAHESAANAACAAHIQAMPPGLKARMLAHEKHKITGCCHQAEIGPVEFIVDNIDHAHRKHFY